MLQHFEDLRIFGVHSQLWHEVDGIRSIPLLRQLGRVLDTKPECDPSDLKLLGGLQKSMVDVVGLKDKESIWIVQTLAVRKPLDSVISRLRGGPKSLFKSRVFNDPTLGGQSLKAAILTAEIMQRAFPKIAVHSFCLAMHPSTPDFELYRLPLLDNKPEQITLTDDMVRTHSIDHVDKLQNDFWALLSLPRKLDNDLFRGLPPCRGGRTLSILASTAKRQVDAEDLLLWKERDVVEMLESDFDYIIPRDKVRHDLVDRLVGNGFMRKIGSDYSLAIKGMTRYLYCLAKYTTQAALDPMDVLQECITQRNRILARYHCL